MNQVVYICGNPRCRAVWDRNPNGPCPACLETRGGQEFSWQTAPHQVQVLHPRTQPPEWPIEGTAHVELEDSKCTMTGVTGESKQ